MTRDASRRPIKQSVSTCSRTPSAKSKGEIMTFIPSLDGNISQIRFWSIKFALFKKKKHFHTSVRPLGKGPLLCRSEGRSAKAERPLKGLSVRGWTKPALVSRLSAAQFPKVYFEWTYGRILWLETFTGMLWTRMFRNTNRYCFVKRSIPGLYFVYFRSFQTSITIFTIK